MTRLRRLLDSPWAPMLGYLCLALLLARNAAGRDFLTHRDGDARMLMLPLWQFTAVHLQAGDVALWNPTIFGGLPHLGSFLPALCYPTTWLLLVLRLLRLLWCRRLIVNLHAIHICPIVSRRRCRSRQCKWRRLFCIAASVGCRLSRKSANTCFLRHP